MPLRARSRFAAACAELLCGWGGKLPVSLFIWFPFDFVADLVQ
jgi:hypothetical protein